MSYWADHAYLCGTYMLHLVHAGLAESISFNVSSIVPPSPIPPTASIDSYTTRPTRRSTRKSATAQNVKITANGGMDRASGSERESPGRRGRKRAKTGEVAVAATESAKEMRPARADISMVPPSSE